MTFLIVIHYSKEHSKFPIKNNQDTYIINCDPKNMYITDKSTFRIANKWENILWFLETNKIWENYEYIWFPDDYVTITIDDIDKLKNIVQSNNLHISQPSLNPTTTISHKVLQQSGNNVIKNTSFIESQMPCFSKVFLKETLLPFLKDNKENLSSGWGIDMWWSQHFPKLLYLVNAISVDIINKGEEINQTNGSNDKNHYLKKYKLKNKI
jgi:hypothetical protein